MTSSDGQAVSLKGWKVAGITEVVQKCLNGLSSLDPFHDIDPLSFNTEDGQYPNWDSKNDFIKIFFCFTVI